MAAQSYPKTIGHQPNFTIGCWAIHLFTAAVVLLTSTVTSQPGFLSIDCGSAKNYTDEATGIYWVTDAPYISTGSNVDGIYVAGASSLLPGGFFNAEKQFTSLRYFDDPRERHDRDCYILPTKPQQQYLLRASFFRGNWTNSKGISIDDVSFSLYLNTTLIKTVSGFPLQLTYYEIIFRSDGNVANFYLVRNDGPSFISSLELRELGRGMYSAISEPAEGEAAKLFLMGGRYDMGEPNFHFKRYPDDAYDRWWTIVSGFYINETNPYSEINGTNSLIATSALAPDLPPVAVMDTAVVSYSANVLSLPLALDSKRSFITAFFQEVDGNASDTNLRGIDIVSNGEVLDSLNVSREAKEVTLPIGEINVTEFFIELWQASWSRLPPILNAMEVYLVSSFNASQTALVDVVAVAALGAQIFEIYRQEGDPCLPVPHFWLQCTEDAVDPGIFRVTGLLLDDLNISGAFPQGIFEFKNLSVLSLSHNNLMGPIEDLSELYFLQKLSLRDNKLNGTIQNLHGLPYLQALYLENNSLSGSIPSFLSSYSYLFDLHLDNNDFHGHVPRQLSDKIGLNFTHTNNPKLTVSTSSSSKSYTGRIVGGLVGGTAGLVGLTLIIWCFLTRKKRATSRILKNIRNAGSPRSNDKRKDFNSGAPKAQDGSPRFGSLSIFSLQEVSNATQKFSKKIGEGSFGPVYLGKLPGSGQEVAAKVKSGFSRQGLTEFRNELELLSRIHHGNLVSLIGYCEEADQQVIIYAYLSNGSLRDHLARRKSERPLDWKVRLRIAVESATGLEYLHFHCYPRIIHRDVKTANILLDKKMVAKVADFGISRPTVEGMTSGVDTRILGTPGYIDPEYFITQRLTQKSDVYSFGVVLLEIISGRAPYLTLPEDGTTMGLVEWVRTSVREEHITRIFDASMDGNFDHQSARMVLDLALECVDHETSKRPDMRQVLHSLAQAARLEDALNPVTISSTGPTALAKDEDHPDRSLPPDFESPTPLTDVSDDPTVIYPR